MYLARSLYNAANASNLEFVNNCPAYHPPTRRSNEVAGNLNAGGTLPLGGAGGGRFGAVLYPNPNKDGEINIATSTGVTETIEVQATDLSGKIIYSEYLPATNGMTKFKLDTKQGAYFVRISNVTSHESVIKKLLIQQ